MEKIYAWVLRKTEERLTRKKAIKATEKANRTFLSEAWGWIDALIFAVVFVFLLNQFFVQLFVIPSPSMVETLQVKDRVLVNKQAYGIELYPSGPKVLDSRTPDRDDIITFYNPDYVSRGPFFDIFSQCLYMATLSFVNIDRDEDGNMKEKLYVKRAVGMAGDRVRFVNGNVLIRPAGTTDFIDEETFRFDNGLSSGPHRSLDLDLYSSINARGRLMAYQDDGITQSQIPSHLLTEYEKISNSNKYYDMYQHEAAYAQAAAQLRPYDMSRRSASATYSRGIYVPQGYVLPLGDNRDNSSDGRYFGPVGTNTINGKVSAVLWPFSHWKSFV